MCVAESWLVYLDWIVALLRLGILPSLLADELGVVAVCAQVKLEIEIRRVSSRIRRCALYQVIHIVSVA